MLVFARVYVRKRFRRVGSEYPSCHILFGLMGNRRGVVKNLVIFIGSPRVI